MNGRQIDLSLFKASYQSLREGKKKQCYLTVIIKFLQIFHFPC